MPFDLGPGIAAALAFALLGAAFVRGYSGFGFSAIFIAFAALVTNPLPLIPVVFLCEMLMTLFQARGIAGHIDWRRVSALLVGAALVLPVAVSLILSAGAENVRVIVSLIVGLMALVLLSGWTLQRPIGMAGHASVGAISGAINSAGVGGLPVAAFLSAQPVAPPVFRATMIVYLTGLDLITLPLMWAGGLVTWDTALAAAMAFPILGLGVWLGGREFMRTPPETFRKFAVLLLLILSGLGLMRAMLM
ncbi:sulfite exporter TauE/SafE family protein [Cognatiyoonia sp. IB215182]|uniref:sulfite exporter TauE/SafE family protein n=1 Tax=Cognatiyoonia sp. IB215182 TaxID=3097353 RepID=UPI002A118399|nr:sulfite exporter TauE/SafE family protein [Cognatiyoonia sp. IB215182]MDX8353882.1 sulfite exporter TauE/SafE family protein [Cognatiyoonia sp. IB215182]